MRNITLNRDDSIETVLPLIEEAMETGEICRIDHIEYLGRLGVLALTQLIMANGLMDLTTGKVFHSRPGFGLIGVDDSGVARVLR